MPIRKVSAFEIFPGHSGNFHFATKLHLLSATFAAENRK
ncbi:hypothetical protein M094_1607 [Bacteroides uniformis str. 3978 T3 ii]|uniref:Uncharacterized protein n=1 Tax=Bacteroides uniformis str. 3978 T3 ii TaxID=1339349 RepID=A0A078S1Y4_BACUN|nr:hypothetical protein M094_1607 [Bacteroides uniformis str. 3978 T3 ii]